MQRLLDRIDRYLVGELTARNLERWLLANLQGLIDSGDEKVLALANKVDAGFVQLDENIIDLVEFHASLDGLLRNARTSLINIEQAAVKTRSTLGSAGVSITLDMGDRLSLVTDLRVELSLA